MKPILFNTEMVRAIQNGIKTATRHVVKPQPAKWQRAERLEGGNKFIFSSACEVKEYNLPCNPGDILYVRETWAESADGYSYRADNPDSDGWGWRPSIHMPREAVRIYLRVMGVRMERLQDPFFRHGSTIFSLMHEGIDIGEQCRECIGAYGGPCCIDDDGECGVLDDVRTMFSDVWNKCYANPRPVKVNGVIDYYESYPWEDIQEVRTYRGKPWYVIGNPWVWVIEFERCERQEGVLV